MKRWEGGGEGGRGGLGVRKEGEGPEGIGRRGRGEGKGAPGNTFAETADSFRPIVDIFVC